MSASLSPGVDVMITIFRNFGTITGQQNGVFSQKTML
jgi:hypothetical protein